MSIDLGNASLDQLIDWIRSQRLQTPQPTLKELLRERRLVADNCSEQRMVDLACLDLMQRRRLGYPAPIEQYAADFPKLDCDSNLLDLIDADLCVANELGQQPSIDDYSRRFPNLASRVRELVQLSPSKSLPSLGRVSLESHSQTLPQSLIDWTGPPLRIPDWFTADRCIASRSGTSSKPSGSAQADSSSDNADHLGRWLIRGRDAARGIPLVLRILELPPAFSDDDRERLLEAGESASKVRNPNWIGPSVAAIQNRYLCVIRPWIHGRSLHENLSNSSSRSQLTQLASMAMALASAHRDRVYHGAPHAKNVIVDHGGSARLIDAGSNRGVRSNRTVGQFIAHDVQCLARLVESACASWNEPWSKRLAESMNDLTQSDAEDACYLIGDRLTRQADFIPLDC